MTEAWRIPHVVHHDLSTIDELEQLRAEHARLVTADEPPTLTAYLLKAVAGALRQHRHFNVRLDEDTEEIVFLESVHVAVAVAAERGLLVPVVRDVDKRSLLEVSRDLTRLSRLARDGELKPSDRKGASITVTNVGSIGGRTFTPIINSPQASILGVGAAFREFVPDDEGRPIVATRLPLSFAFDHRLNDGAAAARFVNTVREMLANTAALSLGM
jgi:pyruvate dehydrogenase E2 component (dihydrolipoamide acetyltransferase)